MQRLIDLIVTELEIAAAVWNRRIRSYVLFLSSFVVPPMLMWVVISMVTPSALTGIEQGLRQFLPLFGVVLGVKLVILSFRTYRKDRAALLRL